MVRSCLVLGLVFAFTASLSFACADSNAGTVPLKPQAEKKDDATRAALVVREKLSRPCNLPKGVDPNTPLKDAMEFLSELYDVPIHIDRTAFKADNVQDAEQFPVRMSKTTATPLRVVLQRLLGNIDPPATYLVQQERIVIVPQKVANPTHWTAEMRHLVPTVDVDLDRRPLDLALREISLQTGINIVLDAKAGEKAKTTVSATLARTAVDTAVILLADMADLTVVPLDTVLYVTTREHADLLREELEKRETKERLTRPAPSPAGQ